MYAGQLISTSIAFILKIGPVFLHLLLHFCWKPGNYLNPVTMAKIAVKACQGKVCNL